MSLSMLCRFVPCIIMETNEYVCACVWESERLEGYSFVQNKEMKRFYPPFPLFLRISFEMRTLSLSFPFHAVSFFPIPPFLRCLLPGFLSGWIYRICAQSLIIFNRTFHAWTSFLRLPSRLYLQLVNHYRNVESAIELWRSFEAVLFVYFARLVTQPIVCRQESRVLFECVFLFFSPFVTYWSFFFLAFGCLRYDFDVHFSCR